MTIGLIDVDSHNFPNYALMKISAYHKDKGDMVEWYTSFTEHYDIVYRAKIFTFTLDYMQIISNADKVIRGGTGYDIKSKLPDEIEHFPALDYTIYPRYKRIRCAVISLLALTQRAIRIYIALKRVVSMAYCHL
jgi:hypothetical protein